MKKGWVVKCLDDACNVEYGTRVVQKRDGGSIYPVYGGGGATFCMDTYNREDRLVVARFAMSEQCTRFVSGKFYLNDSGLTVSSRNEALIPRFLDYLLLSKNDEIYSLARGTAQKNLDVPAFREMNISFPNDKGEQRRVVAILDEAFEGIATARANAEQNLKNARELFESHLQSVFTQRGEGWVERKFGDVCGFVRGPFGGSLKKNIFVSDGYAVYEQQHAIYDQFEDVRYFIKENKFKEMKRFELFPGDLIMSCSGTMGKVAIVPKGIRQGIINQALLKLTPSSKIVADFLKFWMESEAFQDALKEFSGGAAIQNVASVKILKEINVSLPSVNDQKRIVNELLSFREETQRLEAVYQQKITALDELKKALLHKAFSGEL